MRATFVFPEPSTRELGRCSDAEATSKISADHFPFAPLTLVALTETTQSRH